MTGGWRATNVDDNRRWPKRKQENKTPPRPLSGNFIREFIGSIGRYDKMVRVESDRFEDTTNLTQPSGSVWSPPGR